MSAVPYQVAGADFDQWFGEEILKQDGVSVRSQAYALMKLVGSIDSAGHVIPSRFAEAEEC